MNSDQLRELADRAKYRAVFADNNADPHNKKWAADLRAIAAYLRAQADARPVAWMQEGWGPDCGPYVEFYRDDEMGWRDRKEWTPLYAAPAPQPTEAQREQKPQHEPAAVPAKE